MLCRKWILSLWCVLLMALMSCTGHNPDSLQEEDDLVWAVNIGGPELLASDGTHYTAETSVTGGRIGHIEEVKGSQDEALYQTYRSGAIRIDHPLPNGLYDLTFHFAEPDDVQAGDRVFDGWAEGQRVFEDLDVMLFRDGKIRSALSVTIPDVTVEDGKLDLHFEASRGDPVLSALAVRRPHRPASGWELVWRDEFDTEGPPDPDKWNIEEWEPRRVNDEDQAYTNRPRNVRVRDGHLIIEAHREDYGEARYTSARIQSSGKGDFLYGRIEVRAKLPRGQGTWPAIWMLPSNPFTYATTCSDDANWQGSKDCDAWPNSGEIDIMEHVGYQMNHVHGTVHTKAYYWFHWNQRKGRVLLDDVADAFHVYALEWTPERIDILADDTLYFTYINEGTGWEAWPFDQPFHLILNIAVGGMWGRAGGPIDDSIFPQQMLVDYVRVYRATGGK
ncbi:MAG: family 16 glycosylhydrolase [Xanthomonadales bacterium]|nr:family 16 glycosylhydrolase [Xanthomonadales bacterium]